MLEGKLGTPAKFFCYPSGDFDLRVQKAVHQAAYLGAVHSPSHDRMTCYWDNAMAWERIGVWKDTPLWKFKSLVSGRYTSIRRRCPSWVWKGSRVLFRLLGRPLGLTAAPW